MNSRFAIKSTQEKFVMFAWQHALLVITLFIMTLGVALCVRSNFDISTDLPVLSTDA